MKEFMSIYIYMFCIFSGMLHSLIGFLTELICCRCKIGKYKSGGLLGTVNKADSSSSNGNTAIPNPSLPHPPTNSLLSNDNSRISNPLITQS